MFFFGGGSFTLGVTWGPHPISDDNGPLLTLIPIFDGYGVGLAEWTFPSNEHWPSLPDAPLAPLLHSSNSSSKPTLALKTLALNHLKPNPRHVFMYSSPILGMYSRK